MTKMEIELNDSQLEKVKELEENGISVGEAIDLLFEIKSEALSQMDDMDNTLSLYEKIKGSTLDIDDKAGKLGENYGESIKSYDRKVQDAKHKVKWGKEIFKF